MVNGNILHGQEITLWNALMDGATCKTALDIGANRGDYINILRGHGFNRIFAFEPVPSFYAELKSNHGNTPGVECLNFGLSDQPGTVKDVTVLSACTIGRPEQTKSLAVCPSFVGKPLFDMKVRTLDSYFAGKLDGLGFIKLDVDGYEFRVMKGGAMLLRQYMPPILCELGNYVSELGDSIREWIEFVFSLGYRIYPMDGLWEFSTWEQIEPWYPMHTTFDILFSKSIPDGFSPRSAPTGITINRAPWHTT